MVKQRISPIVTSRSSGEYDAYAHIYVYVLARDGVIANLQFRLSVIEIAGASMMVSAA